MTPDSVREGATNLRHTTVVSTVVVFYPFHPLHGRTLDVACAPRDGDGAVTVIDVTGLRLKIPSWMLSPTAAEHRLSERAEVGSRALLCLARLVAPLRALTLDPPPSGDILSRVPETERSTSHETAHVRLPRGAAARSAVHPEREDPGGADRRDRPRHPGRSPRKRSTP